MVRVAQGTPLPPSCLASPRLSRLLTMPPQFNRERESFGREHRRARLTKHGYGRSPTLSVANGERGGGGVGLA